MTLGYDKPLYLLPFDHRHSYLSGMFELHEPIDAAQRQAVIDSKRLIYDGLLQAIDSGVARADAGLLVDEEFGADILRDALRRGIVTAVSVEQSGSDEFEFEYGRDFAAHIEAFDPTFAKVLVRYNPQGDRAMNERQRGRLKKLSDSCRANGPRFMFELLVPATDAQKKDCKGDDEAYDLKLRPGLMDDAIRELQDAGIEPDVWKIEGLAQREDCERIVAGTRRDGRKDVSCIVLGRGADADAVRAWLGTAASVDGFIGFAVGRTTFWDAVAGWRDRSLSREQAAAQIAERYRGWVGIFESGTNPG